MWRTQPAAQGWATSELMAGSDVQKEMQQGNRNRATLAVATDAIRHILIR